ncbi:MAG: DUF1090 domain-containing protein [Alphaproteobacteria bacterium]|nr:DUF1090 domain-containing protein [Alphaproteobacteria bacterium]
MNQYCDDGDLRDQQEEKIAERGRAVWFYQDEVEAAEANLTAVKASGNEKEIRKAEKNLEKTQGKLQKAKEKLEKDIEKYSSIWQ